MTDEKNMYDLISALTFWLSVPLIIANLILAWRFIRVLKQRKNIASALMFLMVMSLTFSTLYKAVISVDSIVIEGAIIFLYKEYEPLIALSIRYIITIFLYTLMSLRPKSISIRRKTDR